MGDIEDWHIIISFHLCVAKAYQAICKQCKWNWKVRIKDEIISRQSIYKKQRKSQQKKRNRKDLSELQNQIKKRRNKNIIILSIIQ